MVTIVLPVSRATHLHRVFYSLEMMVCSRADTNLLVYVDGDMKLYEIARNFTANSTFNERLCIFRRGVGRIDVANVKTRRRRISDIHNELKEHIKDCEFIFLVEDDTLIPKFALKKMLGRYAAYPYAGFVSGMQLGRWGFLHIGVWRVDDIYDTKRIESIPTPDILKDHFIEVDAAGIYCMLTRRENYMEHEFKPYGEILGPDFDFGISLRQGGHKNYVIPSIKCGHMTPTETISFADSEIIQVKFEKSQTSKSGWVLQKSLIS